MFPLNSLTLKGGYLKNRKVSKGFGEKQFYFPNFIALF